MKRALYEHFEVTRHAKVRPLVTSDKGEFFGFVVEFYNCVNTSVNRLLKFYEHKIKEAVRSKLLDASAEYEIAEVRLQDAYFRFAVMDKKSREALEAVRETLKINDLCERTLDTHAVRLGSHVDDSWFTPEILNSTFFDLVSPASTAKYEHIERVFRLLTEDGFFHTSYGEVTAIKEHAKYLPNFNFIMAMANMAEFTKKASAGKLLREHINPDRIGIFGDVEQVRLAGRAVPIKYSSGGSFLDGVLPIWVSNITATAPIDSDCFEITIEYVSDPWAAVRLGERSCDHWHESDLVSMPARGVPVYDDFGYVEGFEAFVYGF